MSRVLTITALVMLVAAGALFADSDEPVTPLTPDTPESPAETEATETTPPGGETVPPGGETTLEIVLEECEEVTEGCEGAEHCMKIVMVKTEGDVRECKKIIISGDELVEYGDLDELELLGVEDLEDIEGGVKICIVKTVGDGEAEFSAIVIRDGEVTRYDNLEEFEAECDDIELIIEDCD